MAHGIGAKHLLAYSDSQLVVKQVEGTYEDKEESMIRYLQQIVNLKTKFHYFQIIQIPREENAKADSLSKLASSLEDCQTRHIIVHYLPKARTPLAVQPIVAGKDWRTPIIKWIEEGVLPESRWEAARLKTRATHFLVQEHLLYTKSYTHPLLKCLSTEEGIHILQEIHSGCCGAHVGIRILANKALRAGYFWPTMKHDASRLDNPQRVYWRNPFSLVYGTEAIILAELGIPSHRVMNFSEECNETLLRENLDLVEELRVKAFLCMQRYKNIMINSYNKRVKTRSFQVGDLVLRRVDALKPVDKLDPAWEGPYKITGIIGRGAYELEDHEGRPLPRPWNIHNLKKYFM
ncbi:UNVERIFIED_CONTAM: hypothetical protein Sradi_1878100 [Sesamum radiatum]|uniref:RNase H type-1 domain-containing protein n=1 Tax=Sesamum radiatum TaxID=300843 RepID=A0AAW2TXT1_SESRA